MLQMEMGSKGLSLLRPHSWSSAKPVSNMKEESELLTRMLCVSGTGSSREGKRGRWWWEKQKALTPQVRQSDTHSKA